MLVKRARNLFCKIESSLDLIWQKRLTEKTSRMEFVMKRLHETLLEFQLEEREIAQHLYLCFHVGGDLEQISLNLLVNRYGSDLVQKFKKQNKTLN